MPYSSLGLVVVMLCRWVFGGEKLDSETSELTHGKRDSEVPTDHLMALHTSAFILLPRLDQAKSIPDFKTHITITAFRRNTEPKLAAAIKDTGVHKTTTERL